MDHNPELCKPYFETGYCPFGDTCIYIHDRTDYKSGHQLEMEYQQEKKRKAKRLEKMARGSEIDSDDGLRSDEDAYEIKSGDDNANLDLDSQGYPYVCSICQDDFDEPVKT